MSSFMGWLLLAVLGVQCFSVGLHQGRHSASQLSGGLFEISQASQASKSQASDDAISEGSCAFCQTLKISSEFQVAAPALVAIFSPGRFTPAHTPVSVSCRVTSAFAARAPPLALA